MNEKKLAYIEETALIWEQAGMTRMAGRIIGYLTICDEDAVSFDRIRKVLNASKGSISMNLKQLENTGFVEKISLPGDRKTYYRISHFSVSDIMRGRAELIRKFVKIFAKGRCLKEREDDAAEWLLDTACFYKWMDSQLEEMLNRWQDEKKEIIKYYRKNHEELTGQ